jgi:hypothetical protein
MMSSEEKPLLSLKTVSFWIVLFLLLANLPYLAAWLFPPENKQFVGTLINADDLSTYLSAIRQGAEGNWLYHFQYSPEPWQPKLMLLPYLLTGKLVGFIGGAPLLWFHLMRIASICFTLAVFVFWVRTIFPQQLRVQTTSWLLLLFGSGLGWLVAILQGPGLPGPLIADINVPEWSIFMSLFHTPHFALGLGLETLLFGSVIRLFATEHLREKLVWVIVAAGVGLASGLTYVYHLPITAVVITIFSLWQVTRRHENLWRDLLLSCVVLLPLGLLLLYYAVFANQDPYFAYYARFEHMIPPPRPLAVVVGAGLLGIFAVMAVPRWIRQGKTLLLPLWLGLNLVLLYLPIVPYTGRFGLGVMVPIVTLAGWYLEETVLPWLARRPFYTSFSRFTTTPYASLRRVWFAIFLPSTLLIPLLLTKTAVSAQDFPVYIANQEVEAADWLAQHSDADDLILAAYPLGNYLPRAISGKLFLGQLDFTTDLDDKLRLLEQFWAEETTLAWRKAFLQEWDIDIIYAGQYEQGFIQQPVELPAEIIFRNETVTIYRVTTKAPSATSPSTGT